MAIKELNLNWFWLQTPSSAESCQGQLQRLWASSLLSFASIIYILSCLIPQAALLPCVLLVANALCCFISGVNHSEEALHHPCAVGSFFPGNQGTLHGETEAWLRWGWCPAWRQPGRRLAGLASAPKPCAGCWCTDFGCAQRGGNGAGGCVGWMCHGWVRSNTVQRGCSGGCKHRMDVSGISCGWMCYGTAGSTRSLLQPGGVLRGLLQGFWAWRRGWLWVGSSSVSKMRS